MQSSQDALASLRRTQLARDDSGPSRVYRDSKGVVYHSVTSILSATSDSSGLENWANRLERMYGPGAADQDRLVAARRGTQTHDLAEYLLKGAIKVSRHAANRAGTYRVGADGLYRVPPALYQWALRKIHPQLPPCSWSACGYSRSLTGWLLEHVTQCFACEFSVHHPAGFAGTADALISFGPSTLEQYGMDPGLAGAPIICDFKTTTRRKKITPAHSYVHQLGAYSLGLQHLTGLEPAGGVIVMARRCGPAEVYTINRDELVRAEDAYLTRVTQFYTALELAG